MTRSPAVRLFVAVDPPEQVCEALSVWARQATRGAAARGAKASLRALEPELLHVTLCFLGNRPAGETDALAGQLATCDKRCAELSLGAPLWLPERNPRALAVELHDEHGSLARLQSEVAAALEKVSGWRPGADAHTGMGAQASRRRFRPHVTVARLRHGAAPQQRELPPTPSTSFVPRELVLYRSWLSPEGASYEAIASYPIV